MLASTCAGRHTRLRLQSLCTVSLGCWFMRILCTVVAPLLPMPTCYSCLMTLLGPVCEMAFGRGCLVSLGTSLTCWICSMDTSPLSLCLRDPCHVMCHVMIVIALLALSCVVHPCWLGGSYGCWIALPSVLVVEGAIGLLCYVLLRPCCAVTAWLLCCCVVQVLAPVTSAPFDSTITAALSGWLRQAACTGTCTLGLRLSLAGCLGARLSGRSYNPSLRPYGRVCVRLWALCLCISCCCEQKWSPALA
jgi:hypothetical protein